MAGDAALNLRIAAAAMARLAPAALLALAAGCASTGTSPVSSPDAAFEARRGDALRNATSAEGTSFEAAVVAALREPALRNRLRGCLRADPAVASLTGYFDFPGPGAHRVELRPRGGAQECVARELATEHLPEPPRYPYQIPFRWPRDL
jgi:hypothetical protein